MRRLNREMIIQTLVVKLKNLLLLLTGKMHSSPCTTKLFPQQEKFMLVELFNATIVPPLRIRISSIQLFFQANFINHREKGISVTRTRAAHSGEQYFPVSCRTYFKRADKICYRNKESQKTQDKLHHAAVCPSHHDMSLNTSVLQLETNSCPAAVQMCQ